MTTSVVAVPAEFVSLTEKVCVATLVGVPANTPPEERASNSPSANRCDVVGRCRLSTGREGGAVCGPDLRSGWGCAAAERRVPPAAGPTFTMIFDVLPPGGVGPVAVGGTDMNEKALEEMTYGPRRMGSVAPSVANRPWMCSSCNCPSPYRKDSRSVPSSRKPAFAATRHDAELSTAWKSCTRCRPPASNAHRVTAVSAIAAIPCPRACGTVQ